MLEQMLYQLSPNRFAHVWCVCVLVACICAWWKCRAGSFKRALSSVRFSVKRPEFATENNKIPHNKQLSTTFTLYCTCYTSLRSVRKYYFNSIYYLLYINCIIFLDTNLRYNYIFESKVNQQKLNLTSFACSFIPFSTSFFQLYRCLFVLI